MLFREIHSCGLPSFPVTTPYSLHPPVQASRLDVRLLGGDSKSVSKGYVSAGRCTVGDTELVL